MPIRSLRTIVAKQKPVTAPKSATVREASRAMKLHNIGALLVVDGTAAGRHLHRARRAVPRAGRRARRRSDAARRRDDLAAADDPSRRAVRAARCASMHKGRFRHLPVVEFDRPLGMVSVRDALDDDLLRVARGPGAAGRLALLIAVPGGCARACRVPQRARLECGHELQDASRHRSHRLQRLPRHDDVGRAEHRSRRRTSSSTTRSRTASTSSTRRRCTRCRPMPARRGAPRRSSASWLARQPRDKLRRRDARSPARAAATGSAAAAPISTRDIIAEACDTSLARLRTDYIDLYQIHWPQRNVPLFGAVEFDPAKERDGPVDPRAGRGHGGARQGRQDPPLRPVQRDDVGRVRIPADREGARRARAR